eukprot:CAMPEP_0204221592 /NCGR_PEP_ID=MMETSP0361-20130328/81696_1 /ASSEMBLY_ACC=CAM_ASM_000343 /TAXON_ID=268821 /ORGANISM="Scrippsiella Hangoei, Strain SHTV-5" /LENGTH=105 /DNA_ID=CAMNT_0051187097 /DNA_START=251 /DNA_END=568 /DNA_ORIENTATION=+
MAGWPLFVALLLPPSWGHVGAGPCCLSRRRPGGPETTPERKPGAEQSKHSLLGSARSHEEQKLPQLLTLPSLATVLIKPPQAGAEAREAGAGLGECAALFLLKRW